jgi:hypothetical protein
MSWYGVGGRNCITAASFFSLGKPWYALNRDMCCRLIDDGPCIFVACVHLTYLTTVLAEAILLQDLQDQQIYLNDSINRYS